LPIGSTLVEDKVMSCPVKKFPPLDRVRELFRYEPNTGEFTWRVKQSIRIEKGDRAGVTVTRDTCQYLKLTVDYVNVYGHQVAWALMTGEWPTFEIDHRDSNGLNNRWRNLRRATRSQQLYNSRLRSDNTTGVKGVSYNAHRNRYEVMLGGRHLGRFKTLADAKFVRERAARRAHGEFYREQ